MKATIVKPTILQYRHQWIWSNIWWDDMSDIWFSPYGPVLTAANTCWEAAAAVISPPVLIPSCKEQPPSDSCCTHSQELSSHSRTVKGGGYVAEQLEMCSSLSHSSLSHHLLQTNPSPILYWSHNTLSIPHSVVIHMPKYTQALTGPIHIKEDIGYSSWGVVHNPVKRLV